MIQLREAQLAMFPTPPGKMKKHELAVALEALKKGTTEARAEATGKLPVPDTGRARQIKVADVLAGDTVISMPEPPRKRITNDSSKAEVAAYRESVKTPLPRVPKGPTKAEVAAAAKAAAKAQKEADKAAAAAEEADDPKMTRIVKRGPGGKPALVLPSKAPKKAHKPGCHCFEEAAE